MIQDYINFKVLYKTNTDIIIFISSWDDSPFLSVKVEKLFSKIRASFNKVIVFIIPWWYRDGAKQYIRIKKYTDKLTILANSQEDNFFYKRHDLNSIFCNQNCWLDSSLYDIDLKPREFDLVINANNNLWKNHSLLTEINKKYKTLFITYNTGENNDLAKYNPADIKNEIPNKEVASELNKCGVGLVLSLKEGSCYASTEYLLCGLPVVSLKGVGGRHVWYNQSNSIISREDNLHNDIKKALCTNFNRSLIRKECIDLQLKHRNMFSIYLQSIYPDENIEKIIRDNFSNKMLYYCKINKIKDLDIDNIIKLHSGKLI